MHGPKCQPPLVDLCKNFVYQIFLHRLFVCLTVCAYSHCQPTHACICLKVRCFGLLLPPTLASTARFPVIVGIFSDPLPCHHQLLLAVFPKYTPAEVVFGHGAVSCQDLILRKKRPYVCNYVTEVDPCGTAYLMFFVPAVGIKLPRRLASICIVKDAFVAIEVFVFLKSMQLLTTLRVRIHRNNFFVSAY